MVKKLITVGILLAMCISNTTFATSEHDQFKEHAKKEKVRLITGSASGTYSQFAQDMSNFFNDNGNIRLISVLGEGSKQNIYDLLYYVGMDMALVQSDVLEAIANDPAIPDLDVKAKISYITKLYNEEIHVLVKDEISSFEQLAGQKVSIGTKGSGSNMTARVIFGALGMEVKYINQDFETGKDSLKRGGVSALVLVAGKPVDGIERIKKEEGLKLLNVEIQKSLSDAGYLGETFSSDDYPNLVDDTIDTIAVGAVLAVYNWQPYDTDRYRKTDIITHKILSSLKFLRAERFHEKWRSVDPFSELNGWQRFKPAKDWVRENN